MMAAGTAVNEGLAVTVLEPMPRPLRKVMITGKGRCNLTNNTSLDGLISSVPNGGRFLYSAFSDFGPQDVMALFEDLGVPLKTERGNRVFPQSDKAVDIVDALTRYAKGAEIIHDAAAEILCENGKACAVLTKGGRKIETDAVLLATGGLSYPATGSTGDGYRIAEKLGHTVTALRPSLVPLVAHEGFCEQLQGLSLKNVTLTVFEEGRKKPIYKDFGELLFTHFGLTGPLVLSASAHMRKLGAVPYTAVIDLKPALDAQALDARLLKDFAKFCNKDFQNALDELLPRKMIPVFVRLSGISPHEKVNEITKGERQKLLHLFKGLTVHITAARPVEEAIVTSGGVKLSEVDPSTMQSKLIKGLYFAGELLDLDAYTGGFNLQIAFSTGHLAAKSVMCYTE